MCERKTERNNKAGKYGYRRPGNGCYVMVTAWLVFRHLLRPLAHAAADRSPPGQDEIIIIIIIIQPLREVRACFEDKRVPDVIILLFM